MAHEYIKESETFNTSRNGTVPKPTQEEVQANKVLQANGEWVENAGSQGVQDVEVNGTSVVNQHGVAEIPAIPSTLNDLSDVDVSGVSDGDELFFDEQQNKWIPAAPAFYDKLSDLEDVEISNLSDGDVLKYKSSSQKWKNQSADYPIGKLLWTGNFSGSGSIPITGLSDWLIIGVCNYSGTDQDTYIAIGSLKRGGSNFGGYMSANITTWGYRFGVSGNSLVVDSEDRGICWSGGTTYQSSSNCSVRAIYGLIKKPTS